MAVDQRDRTRTTAEDYAVVGSSLGPQGGPGAQGGSAGGSAKADIGDVTQEVKAAAGDLKSAAVDQGRALYDAARQQATSFADQRKNDAAQSVSDLASSLRETGRTFEERPNIQAFVSSAADGLEQLAGGLRERSFADLYGEVEAYARRSPMTVAAVAVATGFLLARFIKASADELSEANAAERHARRQGQVPTTGRRAAGAGLDV